MISENMRSLKLAMKDPWYGEYLTFLVLPVLSIVACTLIPVFHCEQSLTYLAIFPVGAVFSYGTALFPGKSFYEKEWKKVMDYPAFMLAGIKRTLLFATPTGVAACMISSCLNGYPKELAMVFEVAVWGLSAGICMHALGAYVNELSKLRKTNKDDYRANLSSLWKWVLPSAMIFFVLLLSRAFPLLNLLKGRE